MNFAQEPLETTDQDKSSSSSVSDSSTNEITLSNESTL